MLQLQLDASEEAELRTLARARDLSIEEYVRSLILSALPPSKPSPKERAQAWVESARHLPITAPPLSDEAVSRENMYR